MVASACHRRFSGLLEHRILQGFLRELGPCENVLDLPCGAGRLHRLLGEHAPRIIEADYSLAMLDLNRELHADDGPRDGRSRYLRCSALEIPLPTASMDLVVSVRLSHHIHTAAGRRRHLEELFRVARHGVICTWFSATSLKNLLRRARALLVPKRPKNAMHNADVAAIAEACGFSRIRARPLAVVGSGHVFGLFVRASTPAPA